MLNCSSLSKTYFSQQRTTEALREVDLVINQGEFVTLVGPSGCGKSTLLRILVGLEQPDSGQIELRGEPLDERNGRFGYMPQRDTLLPWRSVLDNVTLGAEIDGGDLAAVRSRATELLPLFGLDGFADVWPATLSGGMRQRAALLRTFLTGRDVILLDEPFGALDALTRQELQQWLLDVRQKFDKTILFITHDIDEALLLGDRLLVMAPRPGRITADIPITLARPRTEETPLSAEFIRLKKEVLAKLKQNGV